MISYEDLLVSQYLEELYKKENYLEKRKRLEPSPYQQKLPHSNLLSSARQPWSYKSSNHPPKINIKFNVDPVQHDLASPISDKDSVITLRSSSTPARKSRPVSAFSSVHQNQHHRHHSRSPLASQPKSLYKKGVHTAVVVAYQNGSWNTGVRVAAPDLKMLLEVCTKKLHLPFAARRIFLEDGKEVSSLEDIVNGINVFVSMGETFKDPKKYAQRNLLVQKNMRWNLSGITLPLEKGRRKTRSRISKRMRGLIMRHKVRIIVYKNGLSTGAAELVTDTTNMEEFLAACTAKLCLQSFAKILYDWEGKQITDLTQAPVFIDCSQTGTTPVSGPLWVSAGEGFSPTGSFSFLKNKIKELKKRYKNTRLYKRKLECALTGDKTNISQPAILSMSNEEISGAIEKAREEISELTSLVQVCDERLDLLQNHKSEEEVQGAHYRMQHIQTMEADAPLVGQKGLRLKVYDNGLAVKAENFYFNLREALKGFGGNKEQLMERLLDELSTSHRASNPQNPRLAPMAKKLFDECGNEITDVLSLDYDQSVWVSHGEPFIPLFTYCLQAVFDRIKLVQLENLDVIALRSQLLFEEVQDLNSHDKWKAVDGYPSNMISTNLATVFDQVKETPLMDSIGISSVDLDWHFLQSANKLDLVLYPELNVGQKLPRGAKDLWPADAQLWIISKVGLIYFKPMPQLCLGVTNMRVEAKIPGRDLEVSGFVVALLKKNVTSQSQLWHFSPDGTMSVEAHPDLVLTYLDSSSNDDREENNSVVGMKPGHNVCLVISDALPKKDSILQRWAIKQERLDSLGQWKFTDASNVEWSKLAYSWPVCADGSLNMVAASTDNVSSAASALIPPQMVKWDIINAFPPKYVIDRGKYVWPMEGYFIPKAPPLKNAENKTGLSGGNGRLFLFLHNGGTLNVQQAAPLTPIRLLVLRNGERDVKKAVAAVGSNVTNMLKYQDGKKKEKSARHRKQVKNECEADTNLHCSKLTIRELEFARFLDKCTRLLSLPSAARRLFDDRGCEHLTLIDLQRNQLVYITCGEPWHDPKLSASEKKRHNLLAHLSSDVAQIRQYCALRNQETNFVLQADTDLFSGAKLIISKLWKPASSVDETIPTQDNQDKDVAVSPWRNTAEQELETENEIEETARLSCHEQSHIRSDQRFHNLKWPWERLVNLENSFEDEDSAVTEYTSEKFRLKNITKISPDKLQQFFYEDGYIACVANRNLVLSILDTAEGRVARVVLAKRSPDDILQRWIMKSNGEIQSKYGHNMVLTIALPPISHGQMESAMQPLSFHGCSITLQTRKPNNYGHAHQRWYYDSETGCIHAFNADTLDKEITAATHVGICTFAVSGNKAIDQPGFKVDVPVPASPAARPETHNILVCTSCAHALRGRYKVGKLTSKTEFACATREAKKLNLKQTGSSFQMLNQTVDLSTHEALRTLQKWEKMLADLWQKTSVRAIAKEIAAMAETVKSVKILAYKNGDGRLRNGQLIIGSTMEGLLQQCTQCLSLTNAARRLYTEDGALILQIDDLIQWAVDNYKAIMAFQIEKLTLGVYNANTFSSYDSIRLHTKSNFGLYTYRSEEETGEQEREEEQSYTEVDQNEAKKLAKERNHFLSQIQLPPIDVILRYPIEVWVSSGKAFVSPEVVESKAENRKKKQAFRAEISLELDIQKHILRKMKGRRLDELSPGDYLATRDSDCPVIITGHWAEPSMTEQMKYSTVQKLQDHLAEVKANQKENVLKPCNLDMMRRLYKQPNTKRVQVHPNGKREPLVYVWGDTLNQILDLATAKLNLWQSAKILYTASGKQVESFDDIIRDEVVCVSTGKPFIKPEDSLQNVEMKANWTRAIKQHGPEATNITVTASKNATVNVDPFGPPALTAPPVINQEMDGL